MNISLDDQISEVVREISMRQTVFFGRVSAGSMTMAEANNRIAAMSAVLVTLRWLKKHEAAIKQRVSSNHENGTPESVGDAGTAPAGTNAQSDF